MRRTLIGLLALGMLVAGFPRQALAAAMSDRPMISADGTMPPEPDPDGGGGGGGGGPDDVDPGPGPDGGGGGGGGGADPDGSGGGCDF